MEEKLKAIITAHNRMIETIEGAGMTCNLFRGMEVWHKIACEGAEIVSAARSIGIDAKVNMQSGAIAVREKCPMTMPEVGLPLAEIIRNLEDQAEDRDSSIDKDDPDCIFRQDAAALRAAVGLLQELGAQL